MEYYFSGNDPAQAEIIPPGPTGTWQVTLTPPFGPIKPITYYRICTFPRFSPIKKMK